MSSNIVKGTIWSFVQRFGGLAISFISNIVLARLLCPEDFGIIGMVMVFVSLADSFVDGGLGNALIQKKDIDNKDISTVFTSNFIISLSFFTLFFFISPAIERFTDIENLALFIRVESILILIRAFYVIPASLLNKTLQFKTIAIVNLIVSTVSVLVSISMAYCGMGVWSLLCRNIVIDLFLTIGFMWICHYLPRFGFNRKRFKQLFGFGFFVLLSNLVEALYAHAITFLIGKKYSVKQLGYYNQAYSLQQIPVYSFTSVLNTVLFPYFSKIQNDSEQVIQKLRLSIQFATFFIFPTLLFLILCGSPVVELLYSHKWLPCVPFFQLFCVAGLFNALIHINRSVLKSEGYSKIIFWIQIANTIIGIALLIVGMTIGMIYTVYSYVLTTIILYFLTVYFAGKYTGYKLGEQIKDISPNFFIAIICFLVCFGLKYITMSIVLCILVNFTVYLLIYLLIHYSFKTPVLVNLCAVLKTLRK